MTISGGRGWVREDKDRMGDRPIRRSSDRSLGGWWPRVLASLSGRGSPAENEPSRRGHSPIDGRGASGDARPSTAGPGDSGTTRGSGAVTYDISSYDGCAPSATGGAADHIDVAARNGGGPDGHGRGPDGHRRGPAATANIAARSNVVADTTTPLDGRDDASAKGRASGNAACPSRSRAVGSTEPCRTNSHERSDGSSNRPPPGIGGRPPADPVGAGSARV